MIEIDTDVEETARLYQQHCRMSERDALVAAFRSWQLLVVPTAADLARRAAHLAAEKLQ